MHCPQCAAEIEPGLERCPFCGTRLDSTSEPIAQGRGTPALNRGGVLRLVLFLVGVVLLLGGVGIALLSTQRSTRSTPSPTIERTVAAAPTAVGQENTLAPAVASPEEAVRAALEEALEKVAILEVSIADRQLRIQAELEWDDPELSLHVGTIAAVVTRIDPDVSTLILEDAGGRGRSVPMVLLEALAAGELGWEEFSTMWTAVER